MKKIILLLFYLFTHSLLAQENEIQPKVNYNFKLAALSTRGALYHFGLERTKTINESMSWSASLGFGLFPAGSKSSVGTFLIGAVYLQPIHLIYGKNKLKFESGISTSYSIINLNNNPNLEPDGNQNHYWRAHLFIGSRYNFNKKFACYIGVMPNIILQSTYSKSGKFGFGYELGGTYTFKSK